MLDFSRFYVTAIVLKKNNLKIPVLVIVLLLLFSSLSFSQDYSKSITAWFNNIKINIDGRVIYSKEPLFYEDTLYVPIEAVGDALFFNTSYSEDNNTLTINTNGYLNSGFSQYGSTTLYQKGVKINELNKEIETLKEDLEVMEKELNRYKYGHRDYRYPYYDYDYPYYPYDDIDSVSEMQSYLRSYYSDYLDFPTTIYFSSLGSDNFRLTVVVDDNYRSLNSISSNSVENWIEDMHESIQDLYRSNADIEGYIRDYNYYSGNRNFIEFDTDSDNILDFYYP